jgi:hypothetical protein
VFHLHTFEQSMEACEQSAAAGGQLPEHYFGSCFHCRDCRKVLACSATVLPRAPIKFWPPKDLRNVKFASCPFVETREPPLMVKFVNKRSRPRVICQPYGRCGCSPAMPHPWEGDVVTSMTFPIQPHGGDRQCWLCASSVKGWAFRDISAAFLGLEANDKSNLLGKFASVRRSSINWLVRVLNTGASESLTCALQALCQSFRRSIRVLTATRPHPDGEMEFWRDEVTGTIHMTLHGDPQKPLAFSCLGHFASEACDLTSLDTAHGDIVARLLDGANRFGTWRSGMRGRGRCTAAFKAEEAEPCQPFCLLYFNAPQPSHDERRQMHRFSHKGQTQHSKLTQTWRRGYQHDAWVHLNYTHDEHGATKYPSQQHHTTLLDPHSRQRIVACKCPNDVHFQRPRSTGPYSFRPSPHCQVKAKNPPTGMRALSQGPEGAANPFRPKVTHSGGPKTRHTPILDAAQATRASAPGKFGKFRNPLQPPTPRESVAHMTTPRTPVTQG